MQVDRLVCLLVRRWQFLCFLVLWGLLFFVYIVFQTSGRAGDNFATDDTLDFKVSDSQFKKDQLKIRLPLRADEKSFKKWMQFERKIFKNQNRNHLETKPKSMHQKQAEKSSTFTPLSNSKVTTINNVCIRHNQINISEVIKKRCMERTFTLLIYNSGLNIERRVHGFNISYKSNPTPDGYRNVNQTVFFHGFHKFFWPDNFYHFTKQFYFPLHYLISETNSMSSEEANVVLFAKPYYPCIKAPFTQYFFPHLNIHNGAPYAYYPGYHSGGVCFKNAVFSNELHLEHAENSIIHAREKIGATSEHCTENNKIILLRRRKNRRIINALSLRDLAVKNGFTNFSVVYMEDLTMQEQMQMTLCTDVIIGVQGAGLQWGYFMRPLSVVVEVAWPNYGWNFFYSKLYTKEDVIKRVNFIALETNNIANKTECLKVHLAKHREIKLTKEQQALDPEELFRSLKPTYPGKTCDVHIDEQQFLKTIEEAVKMIGR